MQSGKSPKILALNEQMAKHQIDASVCFHMDAHNSEYIAPCDERIKFISGFSGSNGITVNVKDDARMWTDSRYYIAAKKQLEEGWTMMKWEAKEPFWWDWLATTLPAGAKIGMDFTQYPSANLEARRKFFQEKNMEIVETPNLVDAVWESWAEPRPSRPLEPVFILDHMYNGKHAPEKWIQVKEALKDTKVDELLITTLDDICWMLNLRGSDISYNPVFFSHIIFNVADMKVKLFIDSRKIDPTVQAYLDELNVEVFPYEAINEKLGAMASEGKKIGFDTSKANSSLHSIVKDSMEAVTDVVAKIKCLKNPVEAQGMKNANVRDCAAIMKYFGFLEEELRKPDHGLTEYSAAEILEHRYRASHEMFRQLSFDSISSIGANGAIIHYKPEEDTAHALNNDEIYLLDSGGQYWDGTTDITRTAHFGGKEPTDFQRDCYTRVLMGNLGVERLVWPEAQALQGANMDVLARMPLWAVGLDYGHGTGHGVGHYLNVHEGPNGISFRNTTVAKEGMCVSNEPGFYKEGGFGIRIENVIICQKHASLENHLCWENMTVAPYCRALIKKEILGADLIKYIDDFHVRCLEQLTPFLQEDARALDYVKRACEPL